MSVRSATPPSREALADRIRRLAEAKHVLGHRLALAGLSAPAVEATVATIAIAQEELGHARLLYASEARLRDAATDRDPGLSLEVDAVPPDLDLVPALADWVDVLATLATLDTALSLALDALAATAEPWLATRVARMVEEEAAHRAYVESWLAVVASAPAVVPALAAAVAAARARYGAWAAAVDPQEMTGRLDRAIDALLPPALPSAHTHRGEG
jgi:1,2-phenylacetyl-CoA epoxidase catalytic subunit